MEPISRGPNDSHILAAALSDQADVTVTGDQIFIAFEPNIRGIKVLSHDEFLTAT